MLLQKRVHAVDQGLTLHHTHRNFCQFGVHFNPLRQSEVNRCGLHTQSLAEVCPEEVHRACQFATGHPDNLNLVLSTVQRDDVLFTDAPPQEHHGAFVDHDLTDRTCWLGLNAINDVDVAHAGFKGIEPYKRERAFQPLGVFDGSKGHFNQQFVGRSPFFSPSDDVVFAALADVHLSVP